MIGELYPVVIDCPDSRGPAQLYAEPEDVDAAVSDVLALGATRLPGRGDDFRVYADPAGHPLCLVWRLEK